MARTDSSRGAAGGHAIRDLVGKPVKVTYVCPGPDGEDCGNVFERNAKFAGGLQLDPDTPLKCPKCGRTDGFESRLPDLSDV